MTLEYGSPAHMHSFSCSYVEFQQLYKAFTQCVQGKCTKCTRVSILRDFKWFWRTYLLFPIVGDIPHTHCLTTYSLHAFYLMSTMLIYSISSPTNDAYEPKWGLTFSSFSLIHENGNIVYPSICTCLVVPVLDFVTVQGIYTKCIRQMC